MTRAAFVTRVLKPGLYLVATLPLAWVVFALATDRVDGDQVEFIQQVTGLTVLSTLFLTLAVTPLRRLSGWSEVIRVRRLIGLTAFWYALLHLLTYLVFDQALDPGEIAADVAEHPWVLAGFLSFLLLLPLAVTSTNGWIRRLGGRRWQRLHRLIYPAAVIGVLHYLWLVKRDVRGPVAFGVVLGLLLLARLWVVHRGGPGREASGARPRRPLPPRAAAGERG